MGPTASSLGQDPGSPRCPESATQALTPMLQTEDPGLHRRGRLSVHLDKRTEAPDGLGRSEWLLWWGWGQRAREQAGGQVAGQLGPPFPLPLDLRTCAGPGSHDRDTADPDEGSCVLWGGGGQVIVSPPPVGNLRCHVKQSTAFFPLPRP